NTIGSITLKSQSSSLSHRFSAIAIGQAGSSSIRTISDNTIGSTVKLNSINASTASTDASTAQYVYGITNNTGTNQINITGNTIANLNNNYASTSITGQTIGIYTPFGVTNITGNSIWNLSSSAATAGTGPGAAVVGISMSSTSGSGHVISGNTIHSLSNT